MFEGQCALDERQMANVWSLYKRHPIVGICTTAIKQAVLAHGMQGAECIPADVRISLEIIASDAISWLICIGLVPIVVKRDKSGGVPRIHVPDRDSLQLYVHVDELGRKSFTAEFKHASFRAAAPTQVLVWSKSEHVPDADGSLTTPITRLESSERFSRFLTHRVMVAETLRSNPYHVSQSKPKQNNDTDGVMCFPEADEIIQEAEGARRDQLEANDVQQYLTHTDRWGDLAFGNDTGTSDMLKHACRPKEYYLSAEREMTKPQAVASAVHELQEVKRAADERIYQIFGVPMAMFCASQHANTGLGAMQQHTYNATINKYKTCIEALVNDLKDILVAEKVFNTSLS
jgi:hypothetical protein